jgi:hypothetical protein
VPNVFGELPQLSLGGPIRAHSLQTLKLLQVAILRMTHVHTVQIVFGHSTLTTGLIRGFFNPARQYRVPVQRLWVETTCLEGIKTTTEDLFQDAGGLSFAGLRSCRFRRLRYIAEEEINHLSDDRDRRRILGRGCPKAPLRIRGQTINTSSESFMEHSKLAPNPQQDVWDEEVHLVYPKLEGFVQDHAPEWSWINLETSIQIYPYQSLESFLSTVFQSSADSLASLNLDWMIGMDGHFNTLWSTLPTFPHLKALQLRNLLTRETRIYNEEVFLMQPGRTFFDFLLRHPLIQCLSWPVEHFFAGDQNAMIREHDHVRALTSHIGRRLRTLRVDHFLAYGGEVDTDYAVTHGTKARRRSRYRFVEHFAAHMEAVDLIKIEGGIPKDETREILRALRRCPVEKVVIIGTSWPLGDLDPSASAGSDLSIISGVSSEDNSAMAGVVPDLPEGDAFEVQTALQDLILSSQETPAADVVSSPPFRTPLPPAAKQDHFVPSFGQDGPAVLHVLASQFSNTITALKFCGYHGAPEFWSQSHANDLRKVLGPLAQFQHLQSLYIALDLNCDWEDRYCGSEIEQFWKNSSSPDSRALAMSSITEIHGWTKYLEERFAPPRMAKRVMEIIGVHLSPLRRQDTEIRALLWKGDSGRDGQIHELGVIVSPESEIVRFWGPRGEYDKEKVDEKQLNRAWY